MAKLKIRPQIENANAHTPRGLGLLEGSIERDGWIDAITVAADDESISGSARIEVGGAKGWDFAHEDALVVQAPKDRPIVVESDGSQPLIHRRIDLPSADDPRARRLSVAANQIAASDWAPDAALLARWAEDDATIKAMWDDAGWARMQQLPPPDPAELWKGMPEFEQEDQESWKAIRVHFANKEDYEAFARLVGQTLTQDTRSIWYPFKEQFRHLDYEAADES